MSGAAVTGGVLALGGSVLLLFATFLPLIDLGFGGSVVLWNVIDRAEDVAIPILVAIGVNAVYFVFGSVGARRGWAMLALVVNVAVLFNLLATIERVDVDGVGPGAGFYTMLLAAICIVIGCIVGAVAPARRPDSATRPYVTPVPPPPTRGLSEQLRELKSLLDDGLITQDEHDTRRKRILDS